VPPLKPPKTRYPGKPHENDCPRHRRCHRSDRRLRHSEHRGADPPPEAIAAADGRSLFKQIFDDIMGTREERSAAEKAVNHKLQNDLYECVTAAGQPYVKVPAPTPTPTPTGGYQATGDLDSRSRTTTPAPTRQPIG
jgi:hypothetical protein